MITISEKMSVPMTFSEMRTECLRAIAARDGGFDPQIRTVRASYWIDRMLPSCGKLPVSNDTILFRGFSTQRISRCLRSTAVRAEVPHHSEGRLRLNFDRKMG